ncbi:hypothetical protein SHO565_63720 [Streptomyces sp. HO565]
MSAAVRAGVPETQRTTVEHSTDSAESMVVAGDFPTLGVRGYYRSQRLAGVVVDALRGPQVMADGEPLVGRGANPGGQSAAHAGRRRVGGSLLDGGSGLQRAPRGRRTHRGAGEHVGPTRPGGAGLRDWAGAEPARLGRGR